MTRHVPDLVLVLGVAVFALIARAVWRRHVAKPSWDGAESALGKAFEQRKREERDWEAEHG